MIKHNRKVDRRTDLEKSGIACLLIVVFITTVLVLDSFTPRSLVPVSMLCTYEKAKYVVSVLTYL